MCILHVGKGIDGLPLLLPKPSLHLSMRAPPRRETCRRVFAGKKGHHGVPRPRNSVSLSVILGRWGLDAFARPLPERKDHSSRGIRKENRFSRNSVHDLQRTGTI